MDNNKILGLIGLATRANKVVFGYEMVEKAIKNHKANIVLVENVDSSNHKQIKDKCMFYNVDLVETLTSEDLSKSTGRNTKIIAINDEGFAKAIIKLL